jgi:Flp pilus assembly protein TadG
MTRRIVCGARAGVGGGLRDERFAVATELVLLTPLLIVLLLFVVALGRLAGARINVDGAAAQAARAASIATTPAQAAASAQQIATATLGSDHVTCATLQVATDTARFAPGGSVAVTVTCAVAVTVTITQPTQILSVVGVDQLTVTGTGSATAQQGP